MSFNYRLYKNALDIRDRLASKTRELVTDEEAEELVAFFNTPELRDSLPGTGGGPGGSAPCSTSPYHHNESRREGQASG